MKLGQDKTNERTIRKDSLKFETFRYLVFKLKMTYFVELNILKHISIQLTIVTL